MSLSGETAGRPILDLAKRRHDSSLWQDLKIGVTTGLGGEFGRGQPRRGTVWANRMAAENR